MECRQEPSFAELREQPEALQLVLHRVLQLGEAKLDAARRSCSSSSTSASAAVTSTLVIGSAATTTRAPASATLDRREHPLAEQLGIGEEQRRVPAEQHQAGDPASLADSA